MSMEQEAGRERHLTEGELFTLAVPPAGEPEALPRHLSECLACSRALSEWKTAFRELGGEDADTIGRRSPQEWEKLEERTLAAIRRSHVGQRRLSWRWVATIAAALLLFALALPLVKGRSKPAPVAAAQIAGLSAQDEADDVLLRDVARLTRGDEEIRSIWNSLAPDSDAARNEEDRL
jgi:hypothetical protein